MNILVVHNFYQQPGGEDQVFAEECSLLESRGNRVEKFTMHNDAVEGMGKLKLAGKTIWNGEVREQVRDAAKKLGADVVHFHNTFPLISPAAYYGARDAGAAVVQTLHNYRLLCPVATFFRDGHVCEECLGKAIPWPGVVHKCYRDNRVATAAVATMLTVHRARGTWQHAIDRYIALTQFARSKLIEGGLPAEKIVLKPNFVDPDPGIGQGGGGFILFVGRLTPEKGVHTLMESAIPLCIKTGTILKIAGDGPLREFVERIGRESVGIEVLGRRPPAEIYSMMGEADALLFPSEWYEGQPRTIIEAFAKGTPVIASRLGSMPELIEHGVNGRLFQPADADDLSRQTQELLSDHSRLSQMRAAARREYQAKYTADQNYQMLMEIYQQAMSQRDMTRPAMRE